MSTATETFSYDPFGAEEMNNPLPFYKVLRDEYPAYYVEKYEAWAISRFQDVWDVLSEHEGHITSTEGTLLLQSQLLESNGGNVPEPCYEPLSVLSYTQSPVHEELRQAFMPAMRRNAAGRLEELIRALARARLDELVPRGRFNITTEYAGMVAAGTMCHLFGIPQSEAELLRNSIFSSSPGSEQTVQTERPSLAFEDVMDWTNRLVGARRAAGADGRYPIIDGLVNYRLNGRALTDEEIGGSILSTVIFGGVETLPKIIGHGLMELWRAPDQRRQLVGQPESCAVAFEEMLRFCAPAQWFSRTVRRPITIAGKELGVGHRIFPLLMSANRDDREFEDPDVFRWNRKIERHLAFGQGQGFCVGSHVARLEGKILLDELLVRVPEYEIDIDHALRPPSSFQWGWRSVPLVVA
jgi:cytochrome P450